MDPLNIYKGHTAIVEVSPSICFMCHVLILVSTGRRMALSPGIHLCIRRRRQDAPSVSLDLFAVSFDD
jgi:hypothetical protein